MLLTLAAVSLIAAAGTLALLRPPPPLKYTREYYAPVVEAVCPGGSLQWAPTLVVRDAGYIAIHRSFWDRRRNTSAKLRDGTNAPEIEVQRNLPFELASADRANTVLISVPDLPPGAYWLVSTARGPGTAQAMYQVPFVIPSTCDR